ncbi:MAG TPA: pyridoxamine 5'-phosphate oxidase family protein [Dehalococcoidia bacterium]|nr:pyridoxamine 5'-phosphate oxidase family protein [Dehalococcoidia bacterium]
MSLQDLQKSIDESIAKASGFTKDLFQDNHWNATQLQEYANSDGTMTIATLARDGRPHTAIVASGCVDGTFYIGVTPRTALLGNLRRNPDLAFSVKDKVVGRGRAELAGRAGEVKHLSPAIGETLRAAIDAGWPGYVFAIRPERVFAQAA